MTTLRTYLLRLKFEYRSVVASDPRLALFHQPNIWWQQYKLWRYYRDVGGTPQEAVVGPHADLVLDGFQGSGNSFATAAFNETQPPGVLLVHHLHAPAQIIKAVRLGLPTIVTIREPRGAVVSLTSRWPYVTLRQALRGYVRFYGKILPYAEGFVLSPFDQTTRHLDAVIRAVNDKFDCDFAVFEPTEQNVRAVRNPALSSEEERARNVLKEQKHEALEQPALQPLLRRAAFIYEQLEPRGVGRSEEAA